MPRENCLAKLSQHAISPLTSLVCLLLPFITEPDSLCKVDGKWQSLRHKRAWLKWHVLWMTVMQVEFTWQHFEKPTNYVVLSNNLFPPYIKEEWMVAIRYLTIKMLLFRLKTSAVFILVGFAIYLDLSYYVLVGSWYWNKCVFITSCPPSKIQKYDFPIL